MVEIQAETLDSEVFVVPTSGGCERKVATSELQLWLLIEIPLICCVLRLKHSHGSGDPDCLEGALQEAQDHGLDEEHLVPAQVTKEKCHMLENEAQI